MLINNIFNPFYWFNQFFKNENKSTETINDEIEIEDPQDFDFDEEDTE